MRRLLFFISNLSLFSPPSRPWLVLLPLVVFPALLDVLLSVRPLIFSRGPRTPFGTPIENERSLVTRILPFRRSMPLRAGLRLPCEQAPLCDSLRRPFFAHRTLTLCPGSFDFGAPIQSTRENSSISFERQSARIRPIVLFSALSTDRTVTDCSFQSFFDNNRACQNSRAVASSHLDRRYVWTSRRPDAASSLPKRFLVVACARACGSRNGEPYAGDAASQLLDRRRRRRRRHRRLSLGHIGRIHAERDAIGSHDATAGTRAGFRGDAATITFSLRV